MFLRMAVIGCLGVFFLVMKLGDINKKNHPVFSKNGKLSKKSKYKLDLIPSLHHSCNLILLRPKLNWKSNHCKKK